MGRTHDGGPPLRIWANSEKVLSFSNFWVKKQVLQLRGSRAHALIFFLGHLLEEIFTFLDFSWLIMHPLNST